MMPDRVSSASPPSSIMRRRSTLRPTGTAVSPAWVISSVKTGWLANRTSCPPVRRAQASGTMYRKTVFSGLAANRTRTCISFSRWSADGRGGHGGTGSRGELLELRDERVRSRHREDLVAQRGRSLGERRLVQQPQHVVPDRRAGHPPAGDGQSRALPGGEPSQHGLVELPRHGELRHTVPGGGQQGA